MSLLKRGHMDRFYILKWTYTPPDFFEESIHIIQDRCDMTVENGNVEARIQVMFFEENPEMRSILHESLNDWSLGVQLFTHGPYKLSNSKSNCSGMIAC